MSRERGPSIPVTAFMISGEQPMSVWDLPGEQLLFPAGQPSIEEAIDRNFSSYEGRIVAKYFELRDKLFSSAEVVFPPIEQRFPQEVIDRANEFGLEAVEVPAYTGVPKTLEYLRKGEVTVNMWGGLWHRVAPQVVPPYPQSLSKHNTLEEYHFLGAALEGGKTSLVENDGTTPYQLTFDKPAHLLVETFAEPLGSHVYYAGDSPEEAPPAQDSLLLKTLGLQRAGITRVEVHSAIEEHGEEVLEQFGLDPNKFRLHPIRYEDLLVLGRKYNSWGRNVFATFLDGWFRQDFKQDEELLPMITGQSFNTENTNRHYSSEGLGHFDVMDKKHKVWADNLVAGGSTMVRLAISPRDRKWNT